MKTLASWRDVRHHQLFWPITALLLIMLFNLIFMPSFFKLEIKDGHLFGSLVDVLNRGAPLMLLALGMTMVIATAGVDLSVGAVVAITGAAAAVLINPALGRELVASDKLIEDVTQTPLLLVILISMVAGALCGLWNGLLVARARIQPMVATLVLMVAGRGIAQLITNGQIITIYYSPYFYFGGGYLLGLPFPLYIVAAVFLLAWFLSRKTAIGLFVEAVGTNASSSFYSGINEKNIKLLAYTFSGFAAGIAGLIISSNVKSADANNAGLWLELDAILAVVIGGTLMAGGRFSLVGSLLGALIIQSMTTTIYAFGVPPEVVQVVKAVVVLAVVLLYSDLTRTVTDKLFAGKAAAQ
jgi:simple sugar transport system permease protein